MPTINQIKSLIHAYNQHDDDNFRTIILQIAAHEAKLGHYDTAQELKKEANNLAALHTTPYTTPQSLQYSMPNLKLELLIIDKVILSQIQQILYEYRNKSKLYNNGLSNKRKIILMGKSGTGKAFTAAVIASELHLPLFTFKSSDIQTNTLYQIFENMSAVIAVYLFDTINANKDWNILLPFIEKDSSNSIIIVTTTKSKTSLKIFDDVITYALPDSEQLRSFCNAKLATRYTCSEQIIAAIQGFSYTDLSLICDNVLKDAILYNTPINDTSLLSAINSYKAI